MSITNAQAIRSLRRLYSAAAALKDANDDFVDSYAVGMAIARTRERVSVCKVEFDSAVDECVYCGSEEIR